MQHIIVPLFCFGAMVCFLCCTPQAECSNKSLTLKRIIEISNPVSLTSGNPFPKYFYDETKGIEYFYNFVPFKQRIDRYIISEASAHLDTSFLLADEVFEKDLNRLEGFAILGLDSFLILPYASIPSEDTTLYLVSKKGTHNISLQFQQGFAKNTLVTNLSSSSYKHSHLAKKNNFILPLGYSYDNRNRRRNAKYTFPNFEIFDRETKDRKRVAVMNRNSDFSEKDHFNSLFLSTIKKDDLVVLENIGKTIRTYNLNTSEKAEYTIPNSIYPSAERKATAYLGQMMEISYYKSLVWAPYQNRFLLAQHVGDPYIIDDMRVASLDSSRNILLVLDSNFTLLDKYCLEDQFRGYLSFFYIQPSKEGFFSVEHDRENEVFVFKEFNL